VAAAGVVPLEQRIEEKADPARPPGRVSGRGWW